MAIVSWAIGGIGIGAIVAFFILRRLYQTDYFRWCRINKEMFKKVLEKDDFSVIELVKGI